MLGVRVPEFNAFSAFMELEKLYGEAIPLVLGVFSLKAALDEKVVEVRTVVADAVTQVETTVVVTVAALQTPMDFLTSSNVWSAVAFFLITAFVMVRHVTPASTAQPFSCTARRAALTWQVLNATRCDLGFVFIEWTSHPGKWAPAMIAHDKTMELFDKPLISSPLKHFYYYVFHAGTTIAYLLEFLIPRFITNAAVLLLSHQGCDPYGAQANNLYCQGDRPTMLAFALQMGVSGFAAAYFAFAAITLSMLLVKYAMEKTFKCLRLHGPWGPQDDQPHC